MLEYTWIVAKQVGIMSALMLVGYVLFKKKFLDNHTTEQLAGILLKIIAPALVIVAYQRDFDSQLAKSLAICYVISLACHLLAAVIAWKVVPAKRFAQYKIGQISLVITNCGFIGFPLLEALIGPQGVLYGSCYLVICSIFNWTYALLVLTGKKETCSLKSILWNPGTIGVVIGLFFFITPVRLPAIFQEALEGVASLNTPLAMIVLGAYIAQEDLLGCLKDKQVYYLSLWRLLLIPAIFVAVFNFLPLEKELLMSVLIPAVAPSGLAVSMLAQMCHDDFAFGSRIIAMTTLFSIFTIPLVMTVAQAIW